MNIEPNNMRLRSENLVKIYGRREVVRTVSLEVNQGEIVGLLGPNGAGKTTTFYMVVGFIKPNEGRVFLEGEDITDLPMYKRAKRGIGYLPQEPSVFRKLTVENNVRAVLEMTALSKKEQRERLEELIDEFGLEKVRKSRGTPFRAESAAGPRLPVPLPPAPNSSCWMSLSPALTLLRWKTSNTSCTS